MAYTQKILQFKQRGVDFRVDGDALIFDDPRGMLSEEERMLLLANKAEIIANRKRFQEVIDRINEAKSKVFAEHPGRFDFSRDTPEVREAEQDLDEAMADFIEGIASMETVRSAWQRFIRALDVQYTAEEPKQLRLI